MRTFYKSIRLPLIGVAFLLLCSIAVNAQDKSKKHFPATPSAALSKIDTTSYVLTEAQVVQISQLLSYGDGVAGNSDKISSRDYNNFHFLVLKIDSVLRVQYVKHHPVKKDAKNP